MRYKKIDRGGAIPPCFPLYGYKYYRDTMECETYGTRDD